MPRAFYPIDEEFEKSDTLNIFYEHYERVEDHKLLIEIERLDRVILKINNIKKYLENKK